MDVSRAHLVAAAMGLGVRFGGAIGYRDLVEMEAPELLDVLDELDRANKARAEAESGEGI